MAIKRNLLIFIILSLFLLASSAQEVPLLLKGVWNRVDRYFVFDSGYVSQDGGISIPQVVLKTFYGWYDDRAAESSEYTAQNPRPVNNTTSKDSAQEIKINYIPLTEELLSDTEIELENGDTIRAEGEPSGAWLLEVKYPGIKDVYYIPVAVIGSSLYLNFLLKVEEQSSLPFSSLLEGITVSSENGEAGFWQDSGPVSSLLISPPVVTRQRIAPRQNELLSYFVSEDSVYPIRYWLTDMDFDPERKAILDDGENEYKVPAHIRVAGKTYTCVTGKRSRIRNVKKTESLPLGFTMNSTLVTKNGEDENGKLVSYIVRTSTICALGEPYLKLENGKTLEDLLAEDSEKRPPEPLPLFPPHGPLDFDWSIIEDPPKDWNRRMLDLGK